MSSPPSLPIIVWSRPSSDLKSVLKPSQVNPQLRPLQAVLHAGGLRVSLAHSSDENNQPPTLRMSPWPSKLLASHLAVSPASPSLLLTSRVPAVTAATRATFLGLASSFFSQALPLLFPSALGGWCCPQIHLSQNLRGDLTWNYGCYRFMC